MRLPSMKYTSRIVKSKQLKFGGLAHYLGAQDGELWDMRNLTSDHYPLLASRTQRGMIRKLEQPGGLYCWGKLCWVDGTGFYYDGVKKGTVTLGQKRFAALGGYIIILPDKKWYNIDTGEFGAIESTWSGTELTFTSGMNGTGNVILKDKVDWRRYFRVGDTVTISGCTSVPGNNKSLTIRAIDGARLIFGDDSFVVNESESSYTESGAMQIQRRMPDLNYLWAHENRLWGCTGTTVYASKSGDIFNWYAYDGLGTDAWSWSPGDEGAFTGCIAYAGYAVFFKEDQICKIYGSLPSDFQMLGSATLGLSEGCAGSLAVAGETLFYMNRNGVMAYTGGVPQPICEAFGVDKFTEAAAGSDGLKYYISMKGPKGWGLYVYDTQKGLWHREDDLHVTHFARYDGGLYMLDAEGCIWVTGQLPEGAAMEAPVEWMAEFSDFTDQEPNRKGFGKIQLRLELDPGAVCQVWVQYDSDGQWHKIWNALEETVKRSYYLPVVPRRADHYRLKLTGTGGCRIYSMAREFYIGSELRN